MSETLKGALKDKFGDVEIIDKEGSFEFKCDACGVCCTNRSGGGEIIVSPYDVFCLAKGLSVSMEEIIDKHLMFNLGSSSKMPIFTLKNKFRPDGYNVCTFLRAKEGKKLCSVHGFKPSVCGLYPLGRVTENMTKIRYINQKEGCGNKSKKGTQVNKLREWVPGVDNSENAFRLFNDFIGTSFNILKFDKFMESEKIEHSYKGIFVAYLTTHLYSNYDTDKNFEDQFKEKSEKIHEFLKIMVTVCQKFDKDVIAKFKDFGNEENRNDALLKLVQISAEDELINGEIIHAL